MNAKPDDLIGEGNLLGLATSVTGRRRNEGREERPLLFEGLQSPSSDRSFF